MAWLPSIVWLLLLALLPWWIDLPLLIGLTAAQLVRAERLVAHVGTLRSALRWGFPGLLLSLLRALGGDALALVLTLLSALVGFSLIVLLENWLDRDRTREPSPSSDADWPELALAPIGPAATIIELQPPIWQTAADRFADPLGGELHWQAQTLQLVDGSRLEGVEPRCCFDADGRWLAVPLAMGSGLVLRDRQRGRQHRLQGWQLCGWHDGQPWLMRDPDSAPLALEHVLAHDED